VSYFISSMRLCTDRVGRLAYVDAFSIVAIEEPAGDFACIWHVKQLDRDTGITLPELFPNFRQTPSNASVCSYADIKVGEPWTV
jgi:hypothetical protein